MDKEKALNVVESLRKEGMTDEQLATAFFIMYHEDEITLEDLKMLYDIIDYELDEEFLALSEEERKAMIIYDEEDE